MTSETDRRLLLQLARSAIVAHIQRVEPPLVEPAVVLTIPGAAFVTIHNRADLRGCIGHLETDQPLGQLIARCAIAAATSDPRFPPIAAAELPDILIELSLLGPLEPIGDPEEVEIGRHGLVVEMGWHRGLLLPQVATEWNWDAETFLAQTCHKAGLPRDAWKYGAKVFRFEAEVFGEGG
jgi:AmmeMemoRadiSam system protein A